MPTNREIAARMVERQRRERRYFTPDLLGRPCAGRCGLHMPVALLNAGIYVHPTCGGARW